MRALACVYAPVCVCGLCFFILLYLLESARNQSAFTCQEQFLSKSVRSHSSLLGALDASFDGFVFSERLSQQVKGGFWHTTGPCVFFLLKEILQSDHPKLTKVNSLSVFNCICFYNGRVQKGFTISLQAYINNSLFLQSCICFLIWPFGIMSYCEILSVPLACSLAVLVLLSLTRLLTDTFNQWLTSLRLSFLVHTQTPVSLTQARTPVQSHTRSSDENVPYQRIKVFCLYHSSPSQKISNFLCVCVY